jgi:hypothetical protein
MAGRPAIRMAHRFLLKDIYTSRRLHLLQTKACRPNTHSYPICSRPSFVRWSAPNVSPNLACRSRSSILTSWLDWYTDQQRILPLAKASRSTIVLHQTNASRHLYRCAVQVQAHYASRGTNTARKSSTSMARLAPVAGYRLAGTGRSDRCQTRHIGKNRTPEVRT